MGHMKIRPKAQAMVAIFLAGAALALTSLACKGFEASGHGDDPIGPKYGLDDVCEHMARASCAFAESCCQTSGMGHDGEGCEAALRADCEAKVAKVRAGRMTFHADAVDDCLDARRKRYAMCEVNVAEDFEHADLVCRNVFLGAVREGDACDDIDECRLPPPEKAMAVLCLNGVCSFKPVYFPVGEGEECETTAFCAFGLYCARDSTSEAGTCTKTKPSGESCEDFDECLSWKCEDGRCVEHKYPVVSEELCHGVTVDEGGA